jgi:hypothetical protein
MITDAMISNSIGIAEEYFPNLFNYLSKGDFETFIKKAYEHTAKFNGGTPNNNFIVTFFKLLEEHDRNESNAIRNEFGYFNYLLGEFSNYSNQKEFKSLLIGALYNFEKSDFHHSLGEIGACLDLSRERIFKKYEQPLANGKSIDFVFSSKDGSSIYVEVLNIDYNKSRYEKEKFQLFLDKRLSDKFSSKSIGLDSETKKKIYIYPILNGFTTQIIKEQSEYLRNITKASIEKNSYQSFSPKSFGNIQGTFFNLFSIDEIENPELLKS